ncbi:IclR family transcriptional regulator [Xanthobacteraceae bacterium Astr-EGSB]|uniref:IclR family transcriptional regulator n=1 Tax=Astrobacterium formosum TaxID=3069710 RepID=UPI0027B3994D|nr:IclR family transcriptional regulator [Xanthobacteraceae bacterium Astr-EGSB]
MTAPDGTPHDQGSTEDRKEAAGSNLKTLTKGLKALDLLLDRKALRTSDAAAILGTDKGSASRLLQTLSQAGYAQQMEGRSFSLGPKLVGRPIPSRPRRSLRERARPILERLSQMTREAVHVSIPADEHVLYVDAIDSPFPLRVHNPRGTLGPLECTAMGRIFIALAHAPMPDQLKAYTEKTIVDPVQFKAELQRITEQGYALQDEEYCADVRGAAAPLYDEMRNVIAAVGVSGPASRIRQEDLKDLGELVRAEANSYKPD